MRNLILSLLRYRPLMVLLLLAWLAAGVYMFLRLDIEAYPDPSPPLVEVITQNQSWSAEEMERQVTDAGFATVFWGGRPAQGEEGSPQGYLLARRLVP